MKKIGLLSFLSICFHFFVSGQTTCAISTAEAELNVNNVKATLQASSDFLWDRITGGYMAQIAEPGMMPLNLDFVGSLWIGGIDNGGNLKMAAQTYGTSASNTDFWPGPLIPAYGVTSSETCAIFDHLWKVERAEIEAHINDFEDNGIINSIPASSIITWPGRGNPEFISATGFQLPDQPLAPFEDRNGNGKYEPLSGDYPKIKGDQAVWGVFNDEGGGAIHGESAGIALRFEIQALAYAFKGDNNEALFNTTFYEFTLINRAVEDIDSAFVSYWSDTDLGCFLDDGIGCNPEKKIAFVYTTDTTCQSSYPLLGIKVLMGPKNEAGQDVGFSSFMVYNNPSFGNPPNGTKDPNVDIEFYNYMTGRWKDGTPPEFGGDGYGPTGGLTNYLFPDNPADPNGWSMCTEDLPLYDRRFLINSGPFRLSPGEQTSITYAVLWSPGSNSPCQDITPLLDMGYAIQDFYNDLVPTTEPDFTPLNVMLSPNPVSSSTKFSLTVPGTLIEKVFIYAADGTLLRLYDNVNSSELIFQRSQLPTGIYFFKLLANTGQWCLGKMAIH